MERQSAFKVIFDTFKEIDCAIHKGPIVMGIRSASGRRDKWLMDCLRYGDMMLCKSLQVPCHELLQGLLVGLIATVVLVPRNRSISIKEEMNK